MESSQILAVVSALHRDAESRGLFFQTAEDEEIRGRTVRIHGRDLLSFASCSYLGLEHHPALIEGIHSAADRYGAQFSSSRGYVSAPIYQDLQDALERIFDAHVLISPTTTLAHITALPVLATEKDAIVVDHQAHHSVQVAVTLTRAGGARVEVVRHDRLEEAMGRLARLAARHRTVWYATDGVFSMYGDLVAVEFVRSVLAVAPNVRVYIDDAHGMSWAGRHGRGAFLARFGGDPRVVVATSFAKGFGAGGACLVFEDAAERDLVRHSGGPFVFSGPMQPPMIGAALGSASVHLSDELPVLQEQLAARVSLANRLLTERDLEPLAVNETPILFVRCGLPRVAFRVAQELVEEGLYVTPSVFPTVPMRRAGIRLSLTAAHSEEDVERVVTALAASVPRALAAEGVSTRRVAAMFHRATGEEPRQGDLVATVHGRIREVPKSEWDAAFAGVSHCSWDGMELAERVFSSTSPEPEHRWKFAYVLVRANGRLVGAAPITIALQKDDMFSRAEVSEEVERIRRTDRYALTSKVVCVGTNLSEGTHLYLDRSADWRAALRCILSEANALVERENADALVVRDVSPDPELEAALGEEGLVRVPGLPSYEIDRLGNDEAEWAASLSRRGRRLLRSVEEAGREFQVTYHGAGRSPIAAELLMKFDEHYRRLAGQRLRLNIFGLPSRLFTALAESPAWEIGVLWLPGPSGLTPAVFWAAHIGGDSYSPLLCGLDPRWRESHQSYRSMLLHVVRRAREIGAKRLRLGMDADLEKQRVGAHAVPTSYFVHALDDFGGEVLREVAERVALTLHTGVQDGR